MNERVQITIFITIFFILYGAMHLFVFNQLSEYFSIEKNIFFYLLIILCTVSYVVTTVLESKFNNILTKDLYIMAAVWLGLLSMLFITGIIIDILLFFIAIPPFYAGMIIICSSIIICIAGMINMVLIKVNHVVLESGKVSKDLKIVHLSDFHIGPIHKSKFLEKIIYFTNKLKPDIVVITGDLVDGKFDYKSDAFKALNNINAKTFFVMGNHDYYAGTARVEALLRQYPIAILRDESIIYDELQIIGFDDSEDKHKIEHGLKSISIIHDKFSILLYHRPEGFKYAATRHIDLMLAGHTHSGQIFPFNIFSYFANGYLQGLYKDGNSSLYVSAGVGTWGPPMRTGSRSEIVEIIIHKKNEK
jgi:predicted MPP superfamily phosphohydrolase